MIENYVNAEYLHSVMWRRYLRLLSILSFAGAAYAVFFLAPLERVMGAVQKIFYFHVGSAVSCYITIAILFFSSVLYLLSGKVAWDLVSRAASSVSLLLCSIVLFSGMIWGHSAWNTAWRWEPRLTSFLILWLVLLSNVVVRNFLANDPRVKNFAAVLGVFAAVNIPIVIFSIQLLSPSEQLHPQVISNQGLEHSMMVRTLIGTIVAMVLVSATLVVEKLHNLILRENR